jgi:hypothetical protein
VIEVVQVISRVLKEYLKAKSAAPGSPTCVKGSGLVAAVWKRPSLWRKMRGPGGDEIRPIFAPGDTCAKNIRQSPQNSSTLKSVPENLLSWLKLLHIVTRGQLRKREIIDKK